MSESSDQKKHDALLLIDFQNDFLLPDGKMPVAHNQVAPVIEAASKAIDYFRSSGSPVVAIGNEFPRRDLLMNILRRFASVEGTAGSRWDKRLPIGDSPYFAKTEGSAFSNPALAPWLKERGVVEVVLAGLQAKACVTATAKAALKYGFRVSTIDEAIACVSDASKARALKRLHSIGVAKYEVPSQ